MGHAAAKFEAFPKVPLIVTIWERDEEISGSANFLFDSTVEHFSPSETSITYGYFLAHKLLRYSDLTKEVSNSRYDPVWD